MKNKQPFIWGALCVFIKIVRSLPHKYAVILGGFLGSCVPFFTRRKFNEASERCSSVLNISQEKAREIVLGSYRHFGKMAAEFARTPIMVQRLHNIIRVNGEDNLKKAYDVGKGVMLVTAHLGNWEYGATLLVQNGYPINGLGTDQRDYRITELIKNLRRSGGLKALGKASDLRAMIRALSAGEVIAVPIDQDAKENGIISLFLGKPASTPVGVARLAAKTGCAVVPAFCVRASDGISFDLYICPAISGKNNMPYGKDIQISIDDCNAIISDWIRKYPDQWMWMYPRWESVERGDFDDVARNRPGTV